MTVRGRTLVPWFAAVAAFVLTAWLFLPRARDVSPPEPALKVVLVDASASVAREREWLPWARDELAREAEGARAAGAELAVVAFADGVATGFAPGSPERFLELLAGRAGPPYEPGAGLDPGATRLDEALRAAEAWLVDGRRPAGELVLLGLPVSTGPSPAGTLARLAASGTRLAWRAPPPSPRGDLALLELRLAPRVEAGAPLVALARLLWHPGIGAPRPEATLELEVECDGTVRARAETLALPTEGGELELPFDCGPAGFGRNEVRARVRLASGPDRMPENDRARASTRAEGARTVGVAVEPEARALAESWLAPAGRSALAGLQFLFLSPEELVGELANLDALVSFDVAPGALPEALLESFVLSGGGWLALSGYRFLDEWSPGEVDGPLQRLLPCEPAPGEAAPRDVVLLVDGSGSMDGEPFETVRAAALELVVAALPTDRVSLRFFTSRLEEEHLLKARSASRQEEREAARRAARELLALRVPAGTTFLLRSLAVLARDAGPNETLALLLTDGQEREGLPDEAAEARRVGAKLAEARVRLVVIGVGQPNLELLALLAGGSERVRSGSTLEDLRTVFHRELHGPRLAEGELALHASPRAPGSLADEIRSADGAELELAPVERYVRNRLRPGAEALWTSAGGEPVLAVTRSGLGRVALFASRPGEGWAARYARAGLGEPAEFEGLLRWLARGPARDPEARARLEGRRLRLTGLDPATPARLAVRVLEDGTGAEEALELLPPTEAGLDVLRTRQGRLMGAALPADGVERPVVLLPPGSEPAALAVETGLADEFAWRERPVSWPEAVVGGTPEVVEEASSSRLAGLTLAGAVACLFVAGWRAARGQGVRGSDR